MNKNVLGISFAVFLLMTGCSTSTEPEEDSEQSEDVASDAEQTDNEEETEPVFEENDSEEAGSDTSDQSEDAAEQAPPKTNEKGELENPSALDALVNRDYLLPGDYKPEDLTVPDVPFSFEEEHPKRQIREPAADALETLFEEAEAEGMQLYAISGYRSYDRQEAIFAANAAEDGEEEANKYSAQAGESEHQSGLAMDVSSASNDFALTNDFGETPEGEWLKEHAQEYGFVIRYPDDKTDITGYQYEPWHLRYVGEGLAETLYEADDTLEEYYGVHE
ncbi:M15 family metallopeptidase [Salibacterium salarium]|uniref:M15 family metallopeptidase n=1 Tax=Salibacterium salarium TaxID=284579 RepID=UPI0027D8EEC2|nr:M15 family metallopeptidase [Salibacterium salarium]